MLDIDPRESNQSGHEKQESWQCPVEVKSKRRARE